MSKRIKISLMVLFIISLTIGVFIYLKKFVLKENYSSIISLDTEKQQGDYLVIPPYSQNAFESKLTFSPSEPDYQEYQCNMRTKNGDLSCGTIIGISQLPQDSNTPQEFIKF